VAQGHGVRLAQDPPDLAHLGAWARRGAPTDRQTDIQTDRLKDRLKDIHCTYRQTDAHLVDDDVGLCEERCCGRIGV
jgi:hypothetical protein